jgi:hypothetical protein
MIKDCSPSNLAPTGKLNWPNSWLAFCTEPSAPKLTEGAGAKLAQAAKKHANIETAMEVQR